ncbi:unnamed protein product [Durusdinium trenchii]|uniref:Pentatricopeptide repeat-containing protein, chloroplastic n=1 Tax=Durusdinium trenchii TaxID=1381693 RepID=A0ABP0MB45_9DINO
MEAAGHLGEGPVVAQGSGGPAPRSGAWEAAVAPRGDHQDGHPCMRKESSLAFCFGSSGRLCRRGELQQREQCSSRALGVGACASALPAAVLTSRSGLVRGLGWPGDVVSDTAAINACGRATEWPRAVQLSEKQMDVDVILFNALLGRLPWHTAAVALVRERVDMVSFNSVIAGDTSWAVALSLFRKSQELRLRGDTITTNTLLAKVSWHRGLVLLESSGAHRLRRNRITHNTAITIYEKSSMWRLALSKLKGFQADLISFNAAISAGEKGDQWPLSLHLHWSLRASAMDADVISDCAAISACEKGYRWKQALALPCPSTVGWNAAISACEKDGFKTWWNWKTTSDKFGLLFKAWWSSFNIRQWAWALEMLQSMSGARFQRDVISYNGAASACERMAAVEETWEMALCLFQEANLLRVADPITSNSVLAACARAAAWPAALKLGCAAGDWGTIAANAVLRACASGLTELDQAQALGAQLAACGAHGEERPCARTFRLRDGYTMYWEIEANPPLGG